MRGRASRGPSSRGRSRATPPPRAPRDGSRPARRARRRAAVVAVGVAEDDALDAAEPGARRPQRAGHVRDAGVEHGHAAVVLDQVDVHRLRGQAAAHEPDARRRSARARRRGRSSRIRVRRLASSVSRASVARARRRQEAELAGDVAAVEVGVVVDDLVVGDGDARRSPRSRSRAVGREALERARARRTCRAPASAPRSRLRHGGQVEDLEARSRGRRRTARRSTRGRRRGRSAPARRRSGRSRRAPSTRPRRRDRAAASASK